MGFGFSGTARAVLASAALALSFAGGAAASTITGTPSDDPSFGEFLENWACGNCTTPSTNALNFDSNAPLRPGQIAPYVLFESATTDTVTLSFWNESVALAFFEVRIDGVQTGTTAHAIVSGDTQHSGVLAPGVGGALSTATGTVGLLQTFNVNEYVEIRLALGGERDWDFDWTRFDAVTAAPIPLPAAGWLLLGGLGALAAVRRRKRAA